MSTSRWRKYSTEDGRVYYHDSVNNVTQWQRPDAEILNESKDGADVARAPAGPVWRKMAVAKFGSDEAESASQVYYLNTRTNKTQWERPEDYDGDSYYYKSRTIAEPVEFGDDLPLAERLKQLDFSSATAEEAFRAVARGEENEDCYDTLNKLFCFLQSTGSEAEWAEAFSGDGFRLLKNVMCVCTDRAIADFIDLAARVLAMISQLQPDLWDEFLGRRDGAAAADQLVHLIRSCNTRLLTLTAEIMEAGTSSQSQLRAQLEEDIRVWILLLTHVMSSDITGHSADQEALARLHRWVLQCTRTVLTLMTLETENTHAECVTLLLALNHQAKRVHQRNPEAGAGNILGVCTNATEAALSEGFLHQFNEVGFPYSGLRPAVVTQCLELFLDLMSTPKTAELLYTNDLRVMVDVILRELGNIPLDSNGGASAGGVDQVSIVLQYVKLTELMVVNSQWRHAGESYRRDQLLRLLESTLDHAREVGQLAVVDEIERVIGVCLPFLE